MHLTKAVFATAITLSLTSQVFAVEPLHCHPKQGELIEYLKARFDYKSKIGVPIPQLRGNVYNYESEYLYRQNPKNAKYNCGFFGNNGEGRNVTKVTITHLKKKVDCVNLDMLRALKKLNFLEGEKLWAPFERRNILKYRKSKTWPEFEKWLEQEGDGFVWRGQGTFELVEVIDKRTSYGDSNGSMSIIYDWITDPLSIHYFDPKVGKRRKAEIQYFCDKFTKKTKFESFRYDDLNARGLSKSFDLNE